MNIAIIGSRKTGKTSLFHALIKELPPEFLQYEELEFKKVPEASTLLEYLHTQENILLKQIEYAEFEKAYPKIDIVSDGNLIDTMACMIRGKYSPYTYALSRDDKSSFEILKEISPPVIKAISHFYDYDLLFYLPIEFKYEEATEKELMRRWSIDHIIKDLLEVFGIRHHIITGNVCERKDSILRLIKDYELNYR